MVCAADHDVTLAAVLLPSCLGDRPLVCQHNSTTLYHMLPSPATTFSTLRMCSMCMLTRQKLYSVIVLLLQLHHVLSLTGCLTSSTRNCSRTHLPSSIHSYFERTVCAPHSECQHLLINCSFLDYGQVTIIFVLSVCLFICLFVCLCRVFLSRVWSDFNQTWTYVWV